MPFTDSTTTLPADDITPGTLTGSTVQTAASGRRVVLTPSDGDGIPAIQFFSGSTEETWPGEVASTIDTSLGWDRPYTVLWAPAVDAGQHNASVYAYSGGGPNNPPGRWGLDTSLGSGYGTRLSGAADNGQGSASVELQLDDSNPAAPNSFAEQTIGTTSFSWTTSFGGGFSHQGTATNDEFNVTGKLTSQLGQFNEEGAWQTPTYPTGGAWTVTTNTTYQHARYNAGSKRGRLDGVIQCATSYSSGGQTVFTLPVGYRPLKAHYFVVPLVASSSPTTYGCRIDSGGVVTLYTSTAISVGSILDLSVMSWPLD